MPPHSREELSDALERLGKLVDLAECRIDTEARAHSTVEAQAPYERLRTVLARPDGDAAAIKQRSDVMGMRQSRDPLSWRVAAQDVAHMRDRDELHPAITQKTLQRLHIEFAGVGYARDPQLDATIIPQHLPRHDVGVVLHLTDQHRVAAAQERASKAVSDEVDRLRAVAREDDLLPARRADERCDLVPHGLICLGRTFAHPVQATMDVGVLRLHNVAHRIDHDARLLGGRGAVEIHERLPPDPLGEDREGPPDVVDIEWSTAGDRVHCCHSAHVAATAASMGARSRTSSISSRAPEMNASVSNLRASGSGSPRLRR